MNNTNLLNRAKKCIEYNMNTRFVNERNHELSRDLLNEMLNHGLNNTDEYKDLKEIIEKIDRTIS